MYIRPIYLESRDLVPTGVSLLKGADMRTTIMFSLVIFLGINLVQGFDKASYDITEHQNEPNMSDNSLARIPYPGVDFLNLTNNILEATLLKEGFFTLGTTNGLDIGILDDNEPLTYGHPLARTSFPLITVDGEQYRLDQYFGDQGFSLNVIGDSAIGLVFNNGILECRFEINTPTIQAPELLQFRLRLKNVDTENHTVSAGFLIDPALGTWGDGALAIDGVPLVSAASFNNITALSSLIINERRNLHTGLRMEINFPDSQAPDLLTVDNWSVLAGYEETVVSDLYDLALAWNGAEVSLAPDTISETIFELELGETDFPDGPYVRSQLPQMLDLYDNLVYPRDFSCFTIVKNTSGFSGSDLTLTLRGEQLFANWISEPFSIDPYGFSYNQVPLHFPEIYENRVVPLTLELSSGSDILDIIEQYCFIPASPYSDTGLVVTPDSVITDHYPQVSTRFNVSHTATGQYVFDLQNENLFIYEDQSRIYNFSLMQDTTGGVNSADVVFVLDVTGSMGGEIDQVKTNLTAFTDTLAGQGVDFRLAMVTFLDVVENIYDFTADVDLFQTYIDEQQAHGGGDWEENSLDAIYAATQLQFRDTASRIFIWITDAGYHINSGPTTLTVTEVVDALLANGITCHAVAGPEIRVEYCDPITFPTGGNWFDINGNFLDILLEIADLGGTNNFLVTYDSPNPGSDQRTISLEVHHAGLGGFGTIQYTPPSRFLARSSEVKVNCYPNPFNPSISIDLSIPDALTGRVDIYNLKGQLISRYESLDSGFYKLRWNATDLKGRNVAAGLYFLQVTLMNADGATHSNKLIKLVHSK